MPCFFAAAGVDYIYQNWENNESPKSVPGAVNVAYKNTNTVKLGFEYTPNRMAVSYTHLTLPTTSRV